MGWGKKNRPDNRTGNVGGSRRPKGSSRPPCNLCGGTGTEMYDDIEYNYEDERTEAVVRARKCRGCR